MKNYIPFTVEDMYFANNVDLVHVLKSRGEEFENFGEELRMKSNPNIFLKGHMWYDASTQEGGLPVEFMKKILQDGFSGNYELFIGKAHGDEKSGSNPSATLPRSDSKTRNQWHITTKATIYKSEKDAESSTSRQTSISVTKQKRQNESDFCVSNQRSEVGL